MESLHENESAWFSSTLQWLGEAALPSRLFRDKGVPMRFFVYNSPMRKPLCDLVESCGGEVSGSVHGCIPIRFVASNLAVPKLGPKTVYSHKWILHSIGSAQLQPLDSYVLEVESSSAGKKSRSAKRTPARPRQAMTASSPLNSSLSMSSPDFTEDMDKAIRRLAKQNARELEVEPQSPVFWRKAHKILGFTDCTWEDVRDRYLSVLCDNGEEDHQSGSSSGGEEELDGDLERRSVASESKLMKYLTASSAKTRFTSRRLAEKADTGSLVVVVPQVVDVRKDLMNGTKGHEVFGNVADDHYQNGSGVLLSSSSADHVFFYDDFMLNGAMHPPLPPPPPPSSTFRAGSVANSGAGNGVTAEEIVSRLSREAGVSHKVALHALLVCGGNASKARRYLLGKTMASRPWTVEEDLLIRQATEGNAAEAIKLLSRTRTQSEIIARCQWFVAPAKNLPVEAEPQQVWIAKKKRFVIFFFFLIIMITGIHEQHQPIQSS